MDKYWIVIADSAHAKIFAMQKLDGELTFISKVEHDSSRQKDSDLVASKSGEHQSSSLGGGSYEQKTDPKDIEANSFAVSLVKSLNGALKHDFAELILIAPATFIHHIRKHLSKELANSIKLEIAKDYSNMTTEQIQQNLSSHL